MYSPEIIISQEQAKQFAQAFLSEIEEYIEQHRFEYESFLKSEGYSESGGEFHEVINK